MLRAITAFAFAAAVVVGLSTSAHATLMPEPDAPVSGVVISAAGSPGSTHFELDNPGSVTVVDFLTGPGGAFLSLTGDGDPIAEEPLLASLTPGGDLGAFADTIDLGPGKYAFDLVAQEMSLVTFTVSEVPLPAGVVLLGTAMAGLAGYRRLRAAKV
jgi:hypothetical protein